MTRTSPEHKPATAASRNEASAELWRLAALGGTMASEILGGLLVGLGLDYVFGTRPILTVIFTILGAALGLRGFIRSALRASRASGVDAKRIVAAGEARALAEESGLETPEDLDEAADGAGDREDQR